MLFRDAGALASLARAAGAEGALVEEYDPRWLCRCGAQVQEDTPWHLCEACVAPLLARGWRQPVDTDRALCACGEEAEGWVDGRSRCVPCALRFVQRRRRRR
jgi:CDGSH-type Zn-finger protein